jgi:hypothetical protein
MNRTQQAARLALRQQRRAVPTVPRTRKYATNHPQAPPPAGSPAPNFADEKASGGSPTVAIIGALGLIGVGGYLYFGQVCSISFLQVSVGMSPNVLSMHRTTMQLPSSRLRVVS